MIEAHLGLVGKLAVSRRCAREATMVPHSDVGFRATPTRRATTFEARSYRRNPQSE